MVTELKFSKDVSPQTRQRVAEATHRSLLASKVAMQALALDGDPLVGQISHVARQLTAVSRERTLVTLKLFALLERCAETIKGALSEAAAPEPRRSVWLDFEAAVGRVAPGREVAEAEAVTAMLDSPAYAGTYFALGMGCVRMKWESAVTGRDRLRFVEMCLESDKGYSKTLRTIPGWLPASQATLATIVDEWLDGESNTSIFTNDSLEGIPLSRREQIRLAHAASSDAGPRAPDERELRTMWSALLLAVSDRKDLGLAKESLRALVSQQSPDLINALRDVLPNAAAKVSALGGDGFDDVYAILKPPEEPEDADFMRSLREQEAARMARWIRHLDHALPALKKARFGKDPKAPYSLADQLKAVTGDPSLTATGQGRMELQLLKADIAKRARERLGGPGVDLSEVDPRRLDAALFVAELRAQYDRRRR